MTPEQLSDIARQVGVVAVLLALAFALHKEWIVLGREYRLAIARADTAEQKAAEWQSVALRQLGLTERQLDVSERAVGAVERATSPEGGGP